MARIVVEDELKGVGVAYLATPYSKRRNRWAAHAEACKLTAALISRGFKVLSPIAHSHPIAEIGGLDALNSAFWLDQMQPMMKCANALFVAMVEGWHESTGVRFEIDFFRHEKKPVVYLQPSNVLNRESSLVGLLDEAPAAAGPHGITAEVESRPAWRRGAASETQE